MIFKPCVEYYHFHNHLAGQRTFTLNIDENHLNAASVAGIRRKRCICLGTELSRVVERPPKVHEIRLPPQKASITSTLRDEHGLLVVGGGYDFDAQDAVPDLVRVLPE